MNDLYEIFDKIYELARDLKADNVTATSMAIMSVTDYGATDRIYQEIASAVEDEIEGDIRADERNKVFAEINIDLDRLHEAICEDRKQDAIDILNDLFPDANLRSVKSQSNLFPDRVSP